jgi:hypothetical protein
VKEGNGRTGSCRRECTDGSPERQENGALGTKCVGRLQIVSGTVTPFP